MREDVLRGSAGGGGINVGDAFVMDLVGGGGGGMADMEGGGFDARWAEFMAGNMGGGRLSLSSCSSSSSSRS